MITGGSGLIGLRLVEGLVARGDEVTVLTRSPAKTRDKLARGARCAAWTPEARGSWERELEGATTIVHLAGEGVVQRWTDAAKDRITRSRVDTTRNLVEAIGGLDNKPEAFVCASAIGYYGPRDGGEVLDEESAPGGGFLAGVVQKWEEAARGVRRHGVRDVELRIGVVLGEGGGAAEKMMMPFKLFVGGPVADGKQVISWIHEDDVLGLIQMAIDDPRVTGPINLVAPRAATSAELSRAFGRALHRPSWLPAPRLALELLMGEMAMVLTEGQRVVPKRAQELGYVFKRPDLDGALTTLVAKG